MYNMHKKCLIIIEDITVTLCKIDTSKMYSMHKKCLITSRVPIRKKTIRPRDEVIMMKHIMMKPMMKL